MKIIFVHIPKAAGTSLKNALVERVGGEAVAFEYDRPMADDRLTRNAKCLRASLGGRLAERQVTFGHFLAGKYARFTLGGFVGRSGLGYATILREPLQRAISHYHFWRRTYLGGHRVWEKFTAESWSLERFLLSPEHVDFQSQFLWNFPLENFDYVGLSERYAESLDLLGHTFAELRGLAVRTENNNPEKSMGTDYVIEPALAAAFRRLHRRDHELYARATRIFEKNLLRMKSG